jgi:hypothetical protein
MGAAESHFNGGFDPQLKFLQELSHGSPRFQVPAESTDMR